MPYPASWCRPRVTLERLRRVFNQPLDALPGNITWASRDSVVQVLRLLENVDGTLLAEGLTPDEGLEWIANLELVRTVLERWQHAQTTGPGATQGELESRHLKRLGELLRQCPEELRPAERARLRFILDDKLRESVERDVDAVGRLVRAEEWKAATVLGGSVVEAILLDRLEDSRNEPKAKAAEAKHMASRDDGWGKDPQPLKKWSLQRLVLVAKDIGLIDDAVFKACDSARDFRNLIHPDSERARQPCDRATAHTVYAAVHHLLRIFGTVEAKHR